MLGPVGCYCISSIGTVAQGRCDILTTGRSDSDSGRSGWMEDDIGTYMYFLMPGLQTHVYSLRVVARLLSEAPSSRHVSLVVVRQ